MPSCSQRNNRRSPAQHSLDPGAFGIGCPRKKCSRTSGGLSWYARAPQISQRKPNAGLIGIAISASTVPRTRRRVSGPRDPSIRRTMAGRASRASVALKPGQPA